MKQWKPIPPGVWDAVSSLAAAIVNESARGNQAAVARRTHKLFERLDSLELRYGRQPATLAVRADFTDDSARSLALLRQAHQKAKKVGDRQTQLFAATSMAAEYIDGLQRAEDGLRWVAEARAALKDFADENERSECQRLARKARRQLQGSR